jgi:hypothetical protein
MSTDDCERAASIDSGVANVVSRQIHKSVNNEDKLFFKCVNKKGEI